MSDTVYNWLEPALFNHTTSEGKEIADRWFEAARAVDAVSDAVDETTFSADGPQIDVDVDTAVKALADVEAELHDYYEEHKDDYGKTPA